MNRVKNVIDLVKTETKLQRVSGTIACLLMCLGMVVALFGKSMGLEDMAKLCIQSGFGLIGCLIYIFADLNPKLFLFLCGVFTAVFITNLGAIIFG